MSESSEKPLLSPQHLAMLGVAGLTVLGAVFRLIYLDDKSLSGDELNIIQTMTGERSYTQLAHHVPNVLPYKEVLRFASQFGTSDFIFRLTAALFGIATIPLMYVTANKFFGRRVGLFSALLLVVAPLHIAYSQYVHGYTVFCLLSLLSFYLLWRIYERGTLWDWVAFGLTIGVSIHIHLYMYFVLAVEVLILMFLESTREGRWSFRALRKFFTKKGLVRWLLALGIIALITLPTFLNYILPLVADLVRKLLGNAPEVEYFARPARVNINLALFERSLRELIVWRAPHRYNASVFIVASILLGTGMVYLLYRERQKGVSLLLWLVLPFFCILYFTKISNIDFGIRRLIYMLPMMLMVIAVALVKGVDWVQGLLQRFRGKTVSTWMLDGGLALVMLFAVSSVLIYYYRHTERYDFKGICQLLEQEATPGDIVLAWRASQLAYYCPGTLNLVDPQRPLEEIQNRYQNSERIWYIRNNGVRVNALRDSTHFLHGRYHGLETWIQETEPLQFAFGGGMRITFNRREPDSQEAMLIERAALLEKAIKVNPNRWYLHQSLMLVYRDLGRNQYVKKHRIRRDNLSPNR